MKFIHIWKRNVCRTKRQAFQTKFNRKIPDLTGINQGCRTTGYETRDREVCEEVVERVCVVRQNILTSCIFLLKFVYCYGQRAYKL